MEPLKITAEEIYLIERSIRREEAVREGFYDGRNRPSIIPDKKKSKNRNHCRNKDHRGEE
jgi:hypothetical protein